MTDIGKAASIATYGGSATAIVFGLTAFEIGAIGGLLVGIVGLIVNIYYKQQHLNIARKNQKADKDE